MAKVSVADFANLSLLRLPATLQRKLAYAELVATEDVPPDIVTMQSRVAFVVAATGERREAALVYPGEADAAGRVSVLDELGSALFAASVGETIDYASPHGPCRLRIEKILYQPEHWMRINLAVRD